MSEIDHAATIGKLVADYGNARVAVVEDGDADCYAALAKASTALMAAVRRLEPGKCEACAHFTAFGAGGPAHGSCRRWSRGYLGAVKRHFAEEQAALVNGDFGCVEFEATPTGHNARSHWPLSL